MKINIINTITIILIIVYMIFFFPGFGKGDQYEKIITKASWYSEESLCKEGSCGITASGQKFTDDGRTAASWDYPMGSIINVKNLENGKVCRGILVNDRGPAKRLYRKNRRLDLSKRAFSEIARLEQGIIKVEVERVK